VIVLQRYAQRINPFAKVNAIKGSIIDEKNQQELKSCDVIFGCTDNQSSRSVLNAFSVKNLHAYFDCGTGIEVDTNTKIKHAGGQVRVVIPGMGCLNCISGININIAQQEMLPEADRQVALQQGYIAGDNVHAPAVASLNGVIANLAVSEFMAFVTGFRPIHRYVFYDFLAAKTMTFTFAKDPCCFTCSDASLLAAGDIGEIFPEELIIDEPKHYEGEQKMEPQNVPIQQLVAEILESGRNRNIPMEGDPQGSWLLLRDVQLGSRFSQPATDVLIKFPENSRDPIILVPADLTINPDSKVCERFLEPNTYTKGWRQICPHMIHDVGNEILEFLLFLTGFLANPALCGLASCEARDQVKDIVKVEN
jgi:molybdopterin/thiamine biosynthesis adenylyltransferase